MYFGGNFASFHPCCCQYCGPASSGSIINWPPECGSVNSNADPYLDPYYRYFSRIQTKLCKKVQFVKTVKWYTGKFLVVWYTVFTLLKGYKHFQGGSGSESLILDLGSADQDQNPDEIFTDPKHWSLLQMWMRHGAYRYIGCAAREPLDTDFLVAHATSKQAQPFLTLNAETRFLPLKERRLFKLNRQSLDGLNCRYYQDPKLCQDAPMYKNCLKSIQRLVEKQMLWTKR